MLWSLEADRRLQPAGCNVGIHRIPRRGASPSYWVQMEPGQETPFSHFEVTITLHSTKIYKPLLPGITITAEKER